MVADFSGVGVEEVGPDRVRVTGGSGAPRTGSLKVCVGYRDGFVGEGEISYVGEGAAERGRLAAAIVRERLALTGVRTGELRCDLIGADALRGTGRPVRADPPEVRVRVVGRTRSMAEAARIGAEVETLYTNGPAGGGGVRQSARAVVAVASGLIPEGAVAPRIHASQA